jgi:glucose-6-phosphate isomerase
MKFDIQASDIDHTALDEFKTLFNAAYQNGEDRGGSMEWGDVQLALTKALAGLGRAAQAFNKAAETGNLDEEDILTVDIGEATPTIYAAALLVDAYKFPEHVKWENVDAAWEALNREPNPSPTRP